MNSNLFAKGLSHRLDKTKRDNMKKKNQIYLMKSLKKYRTNQNDLRKNSLKTRVLNNQTSPFKISLQVTPANAYASKHTPGGLTQA